MKNARKAKLKNLFFYLIKNFQVAKKQMTFLT